MKTFFSVCLVTLLALTAVSCAAPSTIQQKSSTSESSSMSHSDSGEGEEGHNDADGHHDVVETPGHDDTNQAPHRH